MNDTKDTIPPTHLTPDDFLKCPRCNNDREFTVLIQYMIKGGIPNPKSITMIEDMAEWKDYNTVVCDKCSFYLTWGGTTWNTVGEANLGVNAIQTKTELLKAIPLEMLESLLKERQNG